MKRFKQITYLLTIAGMVIFLVYKGDDLKQMASVSFTDMIVLLFLSIMNIWVNAYYFKIAMNLYGYRLTRSEWMGLTILNSMYTYLLPAKAGIAVRAVYLRNKYNYAYTTYVSFLGGSYLAGLIVPALLAVILAYKFWVEGGLNTSLLIGLAAVVPAYLFGVFILTRIPFSSLNFTNRIFLFVKNTAEALHEFNRNKWQVFYANVAQVLLLAVNAVRLWYIFLALGIEVDMDRVVMVQVFLLFSLFIAITPGNLGLREGIIAFSAAFMSVSVDEALLAAIIDRTVLMIPVFVSGFWYSRLLKEIPHRKTNDEKSERTE